MNPDVTTPPIEPATDWTALSIFVGFFALVTVMGFSPRAGSAGDGGHSLDEWGLGGRQFGTWITWFLVGGDFYTAYTVIAVPAAVFAVGAYGFFALPYTIVVYPIVFLIMPPLWKYAQRHGHVTAADVVHGRYASRPLELAVALTGVLATMPYIALQLVGMKVVIQALGFAGEIPLVAAFLVLAIYTYSSGLRAPALIAFVKDIMILHRGVGGDRLHPAHLGRLWRGFSPRPIKLSPPRRSDRHHPAAGPYAAVCDPGAGLGQWPLSCILIR